MEDCTWVGLDVHRDSVTAAVLEGASGSADVIRLSADLNKERRLFRRLSERGPVRACYEASGAGAYIAGHTDWKKSDCGECL